MSVPKLRFLEFQDALKWEEITIGDVFDRSKKSEKATAFDNTKIITVKLHTLGVIKNDRTGTLIGGASYFKRQENEFIFSKIDLLHGAFGLVPNKLHGFYSSSDVPAFTFNGKVIPLFFLNWLKANYLNLKIERTGTSSTLKRVSPENFFKTLILVPSLLEQQKIADCLTSLESVITAQSQKLEALGVHKRGLMQQLFPSEGETVPKLRFLEFQDAGDWEVLQLSQLTTKISDGIHTTPVYAENGEYAFINGNNLINGKIVVDEKTKRVNLAEYNKHKKPLDENSILMSINGTIGNLAFFQGEQVILGKSACFININEKLARKSFVYNVIQSDKIKYAFAAELTGSTIKNLSLGTIKNVLLSVPPLLEQQKIADCLTTLEQLITAQKQKLEILRSHKKGLMQQLFPAPDEAQT